MGLARWRSRGWRPIARESHPLEAARASLDDAVPLLKSDPNTTANDFIDLEPAERAKLEQLTDQELLRRAAREAAITGIMIYRALQRQIHALIPEKVGELTVLVLSLVATLKAVASTFKQAMDIRPRN
jgi:hypothetical protein